MPLILFVAPFVVQTVNSSPLSSSNLRPVFVRVTPPVLPVPKELILIPPVVSIVTLLAPSLS